MFQNHPGLWGEWSFTHGWDVAVTLGLEESVCSEIWVTRGLEMLLSLMVASVGGGSIFQA